MVEGILGALGLVVILASLGALIALAELGLFDRSADVRPLNPAEGRRRIDGLAPWSRGDD